MVGPDSSQGGDCFKDPFQDRWGSFAIVNVGGMNVGNQNATYCIHNNMMFPAADFFPTIESRSLGGFRRSLHALAVNDPGAWFFIPTVFFRSIRRIS